MPKLRLTYHASSDTAYLHLDSGQRQIGESRVCEKMGDPFTTILDIDTSGRVVGHRVLQRDSTSACPPPGGGVRSPLDFPVRPEPV
jgi:uncharacterized protein YuzE